MKPQGASAGRASANRFSLFCCAVALAGLAAPFAFEFLLEKKPCMLCNLQRSIVALIGAAEAGGALSEHEGTTQPAIFALAGLNCVISGFHTMVQLGWAADPCLAPRVATRNAFARILESDALIFWISGFWILQHFVQIFGFFLARKNVL